MKLSFLADQSDLLAWLEACETAPRQVFVTHGEALPAEMLRHEIGESLGYPASVSEYRQVVELA